MTGDVVASGFGLPEAPCWHEGTLYVADASAGGVWDVPLDGSEPIAVVPHRRGIAGAAIHADGGFVVGGKTLAWKRGEATTVLCDTRVNDLTTSLSGRVYAGTMDLDVHGVSRAPGRLLMVDLDGSVTTVSPEVALSNGLAFAPGGGLLYHVDSGARLVRVYDVQRDGSLGPWTPLHRWDEGVPDGMAVAEDGSLWVALGELGCVCVLDPDGVERDRIAMPDPKVTSLCFGGEAHDELFVTLGGDLEAARRDGFVLRLPVGVRGLVTPLARVRVP